MFGNTFSSSQPFRGMAAKCAAVKAGLFGPADSPCQPPPPPTFRGPTLMAAARLRRIPVSFLPALVLLALAAALLWLPPADSTHAQDGSAATITAGPVITSSPQSSDTYGNGEAITVALTFSETVMVTGEPRVRLEVGERKRWARYSSADGATLTFSYTVKKVDADDDGISIGADQLQLNKGSIQDGEGNAASLSHPALAAQSGHKVAGSPQEPAQPEPTPTPTPTPEPAPANSEPQFAGESAARSVDENAATGANVGDAITATDADGDSLTYALSGSDAFAIGANTGQITVAGALDHETQSSHALTVTVSDGKNALGESDASVDDTITVTVNVGNVDEAGAVSLDSPSPQAGSPVSASLSDPDGGVSGETWSWAGSANGTDWTAIAGANARTYTPSADDVGKYLQATAGYADGHGSGKSASAATSGAVTAAAPANNEPQFAGESATRSVDENAATGANVGDAITATDADGDSLTYALSGSDAFAIDGSGQITVAAALDYEAQSSYALTVTVSDGRNAAGESDASADDTIAVTVSIGNVDEAGAVSLDSQSPQAGSPVNASLSDPDGGVSGETWSWASSANGTDWTAIAGGEFPNLHAVIRRRGQVPASHGRLRRRPRLRQERQRGHVRRGDRRRTRQQRPPVRR